MAEERDPKDPQDPIVKVPLAKSSWHQVLEALAVSPMAENYEVYAARLAIETLIKEQTGDSE